LPPTQLPLTGEIGEVTVSLSMTVFPTGVVGTGETGEENVWSIIIPSQTPSWSAISVTQSPSWSSTTPSQDPDWTEIAA